MIIYNNYLFIKCIDNKGSIIIYELCQNVELIVGIDSQHRYLFFLGKMLNYENRWYTYVL